MRRRKALQQIGMGLSAGLLAPQLFSSCKKDSPSPLVKFNGTVAIIGAGAAGLYAADILHSKGIDVFVLEARVSLGGRVRSFTFPDAQADNSSAAFQYDFHYPPTALAINDFPVELGAEIVYGSDSTWGKIISVLSIPTIDLAAANNQYILDNVPKLSTDWQGDADFAAVQSFVSGLNSYSGGDVSIQSAAAVTARAQALLNGQAGNYYGSSANRIGALGLTEELKSIKHNTKSLTVKTNPWQDILLSRFNQITSKVTLNTPVASIDYGGDLITITDKNGKQFKANKVIVTVPLSILKSSGISFSPSLPSVNTGAMGKFGMDACMRVLIDFKTNFWGQDIGFIWGGSIVPQYFNIGFQRSKYNQTLSITVSGQAAEILSSLSSPLSVLNTVISELDLLYPDTSGKFAGLASKNVRRKIVGTTETDPIGTIYDWTKDLNIKGGFSYPLVGATHQDRIDLGTAVPGKLFFAGEATDVNGDAGTINGALNSAERATTELIKSITG